MPGYALTGNHLPDSRCVVNCWIFPGNVARGRSTTARWEPQRCSRLNDCDEGSGSYAAPVVCALPKASVRPERCLNEPSEERLNVEELNEVETRLEFPN